jgi:hypothetical protein
LLDEYVRRMILPGDPARLELRKIDRADKKAGRESR